AFDADDKSGAVGLARAALDIFARIGASRSEAAAHALLARALGDAGEAQKAAAGLGRRPIYPEFFTVALARDRGEELNAAGAHAPRLGFVRWQLELDLARGGRAADVERVARAHGLLRLATAAGQPSRRHVPP